MASQTFSNHEKGTLLFPRVGWSPRAEVNAAKGAVPGAEGGVTATTTTRSRKQTVSG